MTNHTSNYSPPATPADLVLAWLRRARESQLSHYEMAKRLGEKNLWMGIPVIIISTLVGASAFSSVLAQLIPLEAKLAVGIAGLLAAGLSALQTFFKFSERAERHKVFAAKFDAVRRELETLHASGVTVGIISAIDKLRDKLDRLAEEAPAVPTEIYVHIQKSEAHK